MAGRPSRATRIRRQGRGTALRQCLRRDPGTPGTACHRMPPGALGARRGRCGPRRSRPGSGHRSRDRANPGVRCRRMGRRVPIRPTRRQADTRRRCRRMDRRASIPDRCRPTARHRPTAILRSLQATAVACHPSRRPPAVGHLPRTPGAHGRRHPTIPPARPAEPSRARVGPGTVSSAGGRDRLRPGRSTPSPMSSPTTPRSPQRA